jgi:hypothetical protein
MLGDVNDGARLRGQIDRQDPAMGPKSFYAHVTPHAGLAVGLRVVVTARKKPWLLGVGCYPIAGDYGTTSSIGVNRSSGFATGSSKRR